MIGVGEADPEIWRESSEFVSKTSSSDVALSIVTGRLRRIAHQCECIGLRQCFKRESTKRFLLWVPSKQPLSENGHGPTSAHYSLARGMDPMDLCLKFAPASSGEKERLTAIKGRLQCNSLG